jgi:hypothetical protein
VHGASVARQHLLLLLLSQWHQLIPVFRRIHADVLVVVLLLLQQCLLAGILDVR